jgi:hypothetical protein
MTSISSFATCILFHPMKSAFSIFEVPKPSFFVKWLSKHEIESWAQHPTYIIDHLRYTYQLSFRCGTQATIALTYC